MLKRVWSRRHTVDAFGGLDRGARIGDGSFSQMENLCADFYPALGPRPGRVQTELQNVTALGAGEGLCYTQGKYLVLPDRKVDLGLTKQGPKKLVNMGAYVLVFPDKKYASTADPSDFGCLEASFPGEVAVTLTPCSLEGADRLPDFVQSTEPTKPANKALWLDTSFHPQVLKEWSAASGLWVTVQTAYVRGAGRRQCPLACYGGQFGDFRRSGRENHRGAGLAGHATGAGDGLCDGVRQPAVGLPLWPRGRRENGQ